MGTPITILDADALKKLWKDNQFKDILLIDIRQPDEFKREKLANSLNVPLDQLSSFDFSPYQDKIGLVYCKAGIRTQSAQEKLALLNLKAVYCLKGGIEQWKHCGLPSITNKNTPIDIMRQVQIVAGSLSLIGVILAYTLSPYFIFLTAFVGIGLILAGLSGFCGMAKLLALMPWNTLK